MKFFHLSDLHLGKRLKEFSLLEDQKYILEQILSLTEEHRPDAVVIAGDVYDKSVPSAEAVELFDDFLTRMAKLQTPVLIISGNHDSPERIAFGADLMTGSGIYMSPVYDGTVRKVTLKDELGPVDFYLLPFIKPVHVRKALGVDETATENEAAADAGADSKFPEIKTYTQAMEAAIQQMQVDTTGRNVLITHQFVTNAIRSESEEISVGGSDNVDASVFAPFDYVALGHLHGPQWVDRETVRYCGSPLKYSFSEVDQEKSVTVVEMKGKGCVNIGTLPLKPLREMRKLKGAYNDLMDRKSYTEENKKDYLHITLTDEEDILGVMDRLQAVYPNVMEVQYDNTRTRTNSRVEGAVDLDKKTPLELFEEFFKEQNGKEMDSTQQEFVRTLIEKIKEA